MNPSDTVPIAAGSSRLEALDALRGAAILWMIAFHLAFDLNHFGWIEPRQQFLIDPFWTWQRVCIVSLFMFCAGASQALAHGQGVAWPRFWRRWLQVAACAALVSISTWFVFPQSWISFGVLHGLAVMVLLARVSAAWPAWALLAAAAAALLLPHVVAHPMFDNRWLNGVGLITRKPITEDYAPIFPWMGMVWLGMVAGPRLLKGMDGLVGTLAHSRGGSHEGGAWRASVFGALMVKPLAFLGRWPLTLYMVHQPVFWGALLVWASRQ